MPDAKIEEAEVHVAKLQDALNDVQQVLHAADKLQKDAQGVVTALRVAAIAMAVGATAIAITVALRRSRRPA